MPSTVRLAECSGTKAKTLELGRLEHVNIRTANLQEMVGWYIRVLGMTEGWRPPFGFPGAWLYAGEHPVVHFVGTPDAPAGTDPKIEHFALSASGLSSFRKRLDAEGIAHSIDTVPDFHLVQVNLRDPDGNHIHIDFAKDEAEAL